MGLFAFLVVEALRKKQSLVSSCLNLTVRALSGALTFTSKKTMTGSLVDLLNKNEKKSHYMATPLNSD